MIAIETHHPADASPRATSSAQPRAMPGWELQALDLGRSAGAEQPRGAQHLHQLVGEPSPALGLVREPPRQRRALAREPLDFGRVRLLGRRSALDHHPVASPRSIRLSAVSVIVSSTGRGDQPSRLFALSEE